MDELRAFRRSSRVMCNWFVRLRRQVYFNVPFRLSRRHSFTLCAIFIVAATIVGIHAAHTWRGGTLTAPDDASQPSPPPRVSTSLPSNYKHQSGHESVIAKVAIGLAITSKAMDEQPVSKMPFFSLVGSFCATGSPGYDYSFYLGHDADDVIGDEVYTKAITDVFDGIIGRCNALNTTRLHLVRCNHTNSPAWAQNDAMMVAYADGAEYLYRVNDDTAFLTKNWTETFISALSNLYPPLIGVVGPNSRATAQPHDRKVLTHDFVHRTHVDIFGFYYPREYPTWYADSWITYIYWPDKVVKLEGVEVSHTQVLGQRYKVLKEEEVDDIKTKANQDRGIINRYIHGEGE